MITSRVYSNKFIDALFEFRTVTNQVTDDSNLMGGSLERIWVKILEGVINGCVGVIDDFFQRTLMPRKKDCANNQTAYVSGQYEHYGVNCQGIFDVEGRYLFFGVASPGKTNDALSFVNAGCRKILRDVPASTYVVCDEAFDLSRNLITPFTGSQTANPLNDSFIFSWTRRGFGLNCRSLV